MGWCFMSRSAASTTPRDEGFVARRQKAMRELAKKARNAAWALDAALASTTAEMPGSHLPTALRCSSARFVIHSRQTSVSAPIGGIGLNRPEEAGHGRGHMKRASRQRIPPLPLIPDLVQSRMWHHFSQKPRGTESAAMMSLDPRPMTGLEGQPG